MANQIGKAFSNALDRAFRDLASKSAAKTAGEQTAKAAAQTFTRDTLKRTAHGVDHEALAAFAKTIAADEAAGKLKATAAKPAAAKVEQAMRQAIKPAAPHRIMRPPVADAEKAVARAKAPVLRAKAKPKPPIPLPVDGVEVKELPKVTGSKDLTYLHYAAADNELSPYVPKHLQDLEKVGSNDQMNLLAFTDRDGMADTRQYMITKSTDASKVTSSFVKVGASGEADLSKPDTLQAAVKWAFGEHPSKLTVLDAHDHGAGYFGVFQDKTSIDPMRWPGVQDAIDKGTAGKGIDIFLQDFCEGQTIESNYQLRKSVGLIVGSEDETFPMGMNAAKTLADLVKKPAKDRNEMAKRFLDNVIMTGKDTIEVGDVAGTKRIYQMSVTDATKSEATAKAVGDLSDSLIGALETKRDQVMAALKGVKKLYVANHGGYDWNMRDLPNVAQALKAGVDDQAVKAAADKVLASTTGPGGMVLHHAAAAEEAGATAGLSIYLPLDGKIDPVYKDLDFAKVTRWAEFLEKLGQAPAVVAGK